MAEEARWFYVDKDTRQGPISFDALVDMLLSGRLAEDAPVWRKGMGDWTPARSVAEIAQELPPAMDKPPPVPRVPAETRSAKQSNDLSTSAVMKFNQAHTHQNANSHRRKGSPDQKPHEAPYTSPDHDVAGVSSPHFESYEDVAFYRRQWFFWLLFALPVFGLAISSLFGFALGLVLVPIGLAPLVSIAILISGDVYYVKDGEVRAFGMGNRIAAGVFVLLCLWQTIVEFTTTSH